MIYRYTDEELVETIRESTHAEYLFDAQEYGQGALEDTQGKLSNVATCLVSLIRILDRKGLLNDEEIVEALRGYTP